MIKSADKVLKGLRQLKKHHVYDHENYIEYRLHITSPLDKKPITTIAFNVKARATEALQCLKQSKFPPNMEITKHVYIDGYEDRQKL